MLFLNELYQKVIHVHGTIMQFGVHWGQNLALLACLRCIYEPYNQTRQIVGFDTFSALSGIDRRDGQMVSEGAKYVPESYEHYLEKYLESQEWGHTLSGKKVIKLIKGDAARTLKTYLDKHTETIISIAYFDFAFYTPTKTCLELLRSRVTKGSILVFDELNEHKHPGATLALKDVFGLDKYAIKRSPVHPSYSYISIE
jgi:hypothetical protein